MSETIIIFLGFLYLFIGEITFLFFLADDPPMSKKELAVVWLFWPKYWILGR